MISRMRILSNQLVVEGAEQMVSWFIDMHLSPKKSLLELRTQLTAQGTSPK